MHRRALLTLLRRYRRACPGEGRVVDRFEQFVLGHDDCLLRSCLPGHVTASAWIVSSDHRRYLLTHHRKLCCWLQLGGHVDGTTEVQEAALREAREESGMERFELFPGDGEVTPLDLDVHRIPACGDEPEHLHYDVRFLLIAAAGQSLVRSDESMDLRWFSSADLGAISGEESLLRLARKAAVCLGTVVGPDAEG